MHNSPPPRPDDQLSGPPPVLRSWRNLYILVIVNLIILIGIFYLITEVYS